MADPVNEDLPGDAEEVENEADAEGEGGEEDLTGLKSALGRLKTEKSKLKDELAQTKAELAFTKSVPRGLKNVKAARALAKEFDLIKEDGSLDVTAFKKQFPEQFNSPPGNAGEGTTQPARTGSSMNAWIRARAGRK